MKNNKGSVLVQLSVFILLAMSVIIALLSINMMQYKKSLRESYAYQAQLCAKSGVDIAIASMNADKSAYEKLIKKEKDTQKISIQFNQNEDSIGKIDEAIFEWNDKVLTVKVKATYNSQSSTMKGYIKQENKVYKVQYYETVQ